MTDTHCPYCALQCAQSLAAAPNSSSAAAGAHLGDIPIIEVRGRDFPTNKGGMCAKGWSSATLLDHPDRILTPLVRNATGELREASWEEALDVIAARVRALQSEHGRDTVAVFGGGGLTNEKAYQLGKFARIALRTKNIDYNGRFCMSSAAAAANRSLGMDRGLPFPLTDLAGADAIMLLGSNIAETMPPSLTHLTGVRERGGLIVLDPRHSATAALTDEDGGTHLAPVPGTDLVVLQALIHEVIAHRWFDQEYVEQRASGFDQIAQAAAQWWPERAASVCGIPAEVLTQTAAQLAAASPHRGGAGAYLLTGRGVEQSRQGTDTVSATITLALLLGLIGREGSGYGAITGQGNGQGGREHGQKADQLPGYRMIDDPAAREHVAAVWGVDPAIIPGKGLPATQLLASLAEPDGPCALFVHGSNLTVSAPNAGRVTDALRSLELLVVCDFLPSETAELADVVLPVLEWAEEEGTMTSLEGRVIRRRAALPAPGQARSELWVWQQLAARLDAPGTWSTDAAEVFAELARASAGGIADYSGITYERLDAGEAIYWPCPSTQAGKAPHPGTPRPFLEGFPTQDGRARMIPVQHRGPADTPRPDAPLFLITGRLLEHYQSGAQTRRVAQLNAAAPSAFVQLNPRTADRLGIGSGDLVTVSSFRGQATAPALISPDIRSDTVFMPFHYPLEQSANALTSDAVDPISSMPEFKVCAASVRLATPEEIAR